MVIDVSSQISIYAKRRVTGKLVVHISILEGAFKEFWDFGAILVLEIELRKCKNKNIYVKLIYSYIS